ncbi:hypothetical protein D3C81_2023720 [compost metagenome]
MRSRKVLCAGLAASPARRLMAAACLPTCWRRLLASMMTMKAKVTDTPKAGWPMPSRKAIRVAMLETTALWLLGKPPLPTRPNAHCRVRTLLIRNLIGPTRIQVIRGVTR